MTTNTPRTDAKTIRQRANHAWNNLNFAASILHTSGLTDQANQLLREAQDLCDSIVKDSASDGRELTAANQRVKELNEKLEKASLMGIDKCAEVGKLRADNERLRSELAKFTSIERQPDRMLAVRCPKCGNYFGGHATGGHDICDCHEKEKK